MPEFLQSWPSYYLHFLIAGVAVLLLLLWRTFGRGPRRRRAFAAAQRLLVQGDWENALGRTRSLRTSARPATAWYEKLRSAEAACLRAGVQAATQEKNFEQALGYSLQAAELLDEDSDRVREEVVGTMLAEVRRLFAGLTIGSSTTPLSDLIARTLHVQQSREALFWQGMLHIRAGKLDLALAAFERARGAGATPAKRPAGFIDPPLYQGALLLRQGKAKEALRVLTEANRADPGCPFVATQLGCAMIAAEGDTQLAVRALQRALGPRGFGQWTNSPQQAWVDGLPAGRSFVRRLAGEHTYTCPLWGADLRPLLNQANAALGQGLYRLGNNQDASLAFGQLLQESAPSFAVLRGLGLCLAKLGQYDEAFKHLRTAHELIEEQDRVVAGYLALCGARGKPKQNEDKVRNVLWAIRVVSKFTAPRDEEWAGLVSAIFAEARNAGVAVAADDQIYLCEHLLSVHATDPLAAEAYHHLQMTHPQRMHPEYAWLYCRAAEQHHLTHERGLELFARTFADRFAAQPFFEQQQWHMRAVELAYLELAAAKEPGRFPESLGCDYAAQGEKLLLERSLELERAGDFNGAFAVAEIHQRLSPLDPAALDRLAQLHYRRGRLEQAADLLQSWHETSPRDPTPLVRLAVLETAARQKTPARSASEESPSLALRAGVAEPSADRCLHCIGEAMKLADGRQRGDIAFLGARLAFAWADSTAAVDLLQQCLTSVPDHAGALWLLAALRWQRQERRELAELSTSMRRADTRDPRFHVMAAVCHLAAEDYRAMIEACETAESLSDELAMECRFLAGRAHRHLGELPEATKAFAHVALSESSPSQSHAQALLGSSAFEQHDYAGAVERWQQLSADARNTWSLAQPLAGAMFLSALQAMHDGRYLQAAEALREAGKLGWRDRRLGTLLTMSLVKAGLQLLW